MGIYKSGGISKSERILISTALIMIAAVIGYSAFFVPTFSGDSVISGEVFNMEDREENNLNDYEKGALPVNINIASTEDLCLLDGIGPAVAERIINYRESHGGFSSISELMNVKGIGEKVFEKIKNDIYV